MGKCISTTIDVEVYLSEIDACHLVDELEDRGYTVIDNQSNLVLAIYEKRKLGQDYSKELDELFWQVIGRM